MALYGMADNNIDIPAERDGAMYNVMLGNTDFVIDGIGNEFAITYSSSSLVVTLGTGEGVICGRHVTEVTENSANTTLTLSASDNGYIALRFDLTQTAGNEVSLVATASLYTDDLNAGGTRRDLPLYTYTTSASGVANLTDVRSIRSSVSSATRITGTLLASNWSSNVYTFTNTAIQSGQKVLISEQSGCTDSEFTALVNGLLRITAVSSGSVTIKAMRVQPTIDIPIELMLLG